MRANFASAIPVALFALTLPAPARAQALANLALDNVTIQGKGAAATIVIKRVDAIATNLTKDELTSLFNPDTPHEAALALVMKAKVGKLAIPEARVDAAGGGATLRDLVLINIDSGKLGEFSFSGFDGSGTDKGGGFKFKSGPLDVKDMDLSGVLSALASGDFTAPKARVGSISWSGFEADLPDQDTPANAPGGNLIHLGLGSLTGQNTYDGDIPAKGVAKGEHLVISFPKTQETGQMLAAFGYDKIDMGFSVEGAYDRVQKTLTVADYTISAVNAGTLSAKGGFGGVDPTLFTGDRQAKVASLIGANVSNIEIRYSDGGLFDKVVAYVAASQQQKPEDVKAGWSAMATQFLPLMLGGDPASIKLATAVGAFVANPKGLTVGAKAKGAPVKIADVLKTKEPKDLLSLIDLTAEAAQ